jgi:hypothetical protein
VTQATGNVQFAPLISPFCTVLHGPEHQHAHHSAVQLFYAVLSAGTA